MVATISCDEKLRLEGQIDKNWIIACGAANVAESSYHYFPENYKIFTEEIDPRHNQCQVHFGSKDLCCEQLCSITDIVDRHIA